MKIFEDILGHEQQINFLKSKIEKKFLPHAVLFDGPSGVGKKKVAIEVAKTLLCSEKDSLSCIGCPSCQRVLVAEHPDFYLIGPEGKSNTIKIDSIRKLIQDVQLKPVEGKGCVALIDGVEGMNVEAQNAFLKVLEEPPKNTTFLLVTQDKAALLKTVLSRCQTVTFNPLKLDDVISILTQDHNVSITDARRLSQISQGSVGRALQILDIDFNLLMSDTFTLLSNMKSNNLIDLSQFSMDKEELLLRLDLLIQLFRDLMLLVGSDPEVEQLHFSEYATNLNSLLDKVHFDEIESILNSLIDARENVLRMINPKLIWNQVLVNMGIQVV